MFQLQVPNRYTAELDALIDRAASDPDVASAGYNAVVQFNQSCRAQNDNAGIARQDQCAFADTEYYQAITMFDIFRPYLTLHPVTVGIIDTGLDPATGQFDDVDILYLNNVAGPPQDLDVSRHGTAVAGVIAADDDLSGVNGVASRLIEADLRLVVGSVNDTAGVFVNIAVAVAAGADMINLSLGWDTSEPRLQVFREASLRTMARYSQVLFVCPAGNEAIDLNSSAYAPGGISLPNVITVGGTDQCNPNECGR